MQEIVIEVGPNGDVTVEGKGFAGAECKKLTAEIEKAIGTVEKVVTKPEYHQTRVAVKTVGR